MKSNEKKPMTSENTNSISDKELSDFAKNLMIQFSYSNEIIKVFNLSETVKQNFPCEKYRSKNDFLTLLDRLAYDYIIINWAIIFGSRGEDLHFTKVFKYDFYQSELVKKNFLKKLDMSDADYDNMHISLLKRRNRLIAHLDFNDGDLEYSEDLEHNDDLKRNDDLERNDKHFQKILFQCQSLQKSIIDALQVAGKMYPERRLGIIGMENKSLLEIASFLLIRSQTFPRDITEETITEMFEVYKHFRKQEPDFDCVEKFIMPKVNISIYDSYTVPSSDIF